MQEVLLVVSFIQSLGGEVTVDPEEVKALTPATFATPDEVKKELIPPTVEEDISDAN
jgi:hypothetical protein